MGSRPFDGKRHQAEMVALLGKRDSRFSEGAQRLLLLEWFPALLAFGAARFSRITATS